MLSCNDTVQAKDKKRGSSSWPKYLMLFGVERVLKHYSLSDGFTLTNSAQCLARCEDGVA